MYFIINGFVCVYLEQTLVKFEEEDDNYSLT